MIRRRLVLAAVVVAALLGACEAVFPLDSLSNGGTALDAAYTDAADDALQSDGALPDAGDGQGIRWIGSSVGGMPDGGSSFTIAKPSGVIAGDFMLMAVTQRGGNDLYPPGWGQLSNAFNGGELGSLLFYRFSDGPQAETYTVSGATAVAAGAIVAYRNVDAAWADGGSLVKAERNLPVGDLVPPGVQLAKRARAIYAFYDSRPSAGWTATAPMEHRADNSFVFFGDTALPDASEGFLVAPAPGHASTNACEALVVVAPPLFP